MILLEILGELLGEIISAALSCVWPQRHRATNSEFNRAVSRRRRRWGIGLALAALTACGLWAALTG